MQTGVCHKNVSRSEVFSARFLPAFSAQILQIVVSKKLRKQFKDARVNPLKYGRYRNNTDMDRENTAMLNSDGKIRTIDFLF